MEKIQGDLEELSDLLLMTLGVAVANKLGPKWQRPQEFGEVF